MEKKIAVQNGVIKELQDKLTLANNKREVNISEEVSDLVLEVQQLQQQNNEKIRQLKDLEKENQILKEDILIEQEEKNDLQRCLEKVEHPLRDELDSAMEIVHTCDVCGKEFSTRSDLECHNLEKHRAQSLKLKLKNELSSIQSKVSEQKLSIFSNLFELKEKEAKPICNCKGFCKIRHKLYNWRKSISGSIFISSKNILGVSSGETDDLEKDSEIQETCEQESFLCQQCGDNFLNGDNLKTHSETNVNSLILFI